MNRILCGAIWIFLSASTIFACDCGGALPPFSKEETENYELIFTGKIDSIIKGDQFSIAWFKGKELLKGIAPPQVEIRFDSYSSCSMPFISGKEWLIYANRDSSTRKWTVHYCGRSRPVPNKDEVDEYTIVSGITFEQERKKLAFLFPVRDFINESDIRDIESGEKKIIDSKRDLMHPDFRQTVILLIVSVVALVLIYFLVKKFFK